MAKDFSKILVDLYKGDKLVRQGVPFRDNPTETAKEQAAAYKAHHEGHGRTVRARLPKKSRK